MVYNARMDELQKMIDLAGSKAALAKLLGITRAAVTHWRKLPKGRRYQLQVMKPEWFVKVEEQA